MKQIILLFLIFQLSIFTLQAQNTAEDKEQLKQTNQELLANYKAGKLDNALSAAQKALNLSNKIYGAEALETASAYKNLGIIYLSKKKYKEATANLQKTVEIYRLKPDQNAKATAETLDKLALAHALGGDEKKAEEIYTEALTTAEKAYGKESKEILPFLKSMAEVYFLVKKYDEAQAVYVRQYLTAKKYFKARSDELRAIGDSFDCAVNQVFGAREAMKRRQDFNEAVRDKNQTQEQDTDFFNDKTINGGVVNGKAKKLVAPVYPYSARSSRASGAVSVRVTIDEQGKVIEAKAICGNPELFAASIEAAQKSEFNPTVLDGKAVKVTGTIMYNFVP
jgi:TonB family protein